MLIDWTDADQAQALRAGWLISSSDDAAHGGTYIERDDDQETFADDDQALAHVESQAAAGDEHARKALAFIAQESPAHQRDEDCDVDPETDLCRGCSVYHGEQCGACSGRGFHRVGCPELDATND